MPGSDKSQQDGQRKGKGRQPLVLQPARVVEMTEEQHLEALELVVTLVDSYVALHRQGGSDGLASEYETSSSKERRPAVGTLPPLRERHDLLAQAVEIWLTRPDPRSRYEEQPGARRRSDSPPRADGRALSPRLRGRHHARGGAQLLTPWPVTALILRPGWTPRRQRR